MFDTASEAVASALQARKAGLDGNGNGIGYPPSSAASSVAGGSPQFGFGRGRLDAVAGGAPGAKEDVVMQWDPQVCY